MLFGENMKTKLHLFTTLFCSLLHSPVTALTQEGVLPKIAFEQRTRVLVWDIGYHPSIVDQDDILTDLNRECVVDESEIHLKPQELYLSKSESLVKDVNQVAAQILSPFAVQVSDFKMNPVVAQLGKPKEPVFFLFPSLHMNNPVKRELGRLHQARALDLLKLTTMLEVQGSGVVNTMEGPQGRWKTELKLTPRDLGSRIDEAFKVMGGQWVSGSDLIGEVYGDKIFTQFADSNEFAVQFALTQSAFAMSFEPVPGDPGTRWDRAKADIRERYPRRSQVVNLDNFRPFFDKIVGRTSDELRAAGSQVCELRAREMVRYTYEIAKQRSADVVYMEFGVIHTHGIMEYLKKRSASFIVFSPNFSETLGE